MIDRKRLTALAATLLLAGATPALTNAAVAAAAPSRTILLQAGNTRHLVYVVADLGASGPVAHGYSIHVRDRNGDRRQLARVPGVNLVAYSTGRGQTATGGTLIDESLAHSTLEVAERIFGGRTRIFWWNVNNKNSHGSTLLPAANDHQLGAVPGGTAFTVNDEGTVFKQAHDGTVTKVGRPFGAQGVVRLTQGYDGLVFVSSSVQTAKSPVRYMTYANLGHFRSLPFPANQELVVCDNASASYAACRTQDAYEDPVNELVFVNGNAPVQANGNGYTADESGMSRLVARNGARTQMSSVTPDGTVLTSPAGLKIDNAGIVSAYGKVAVLANHRTRIVVLADATDTPQRIGQLGS